MKTNLSLLAGAGLALFTSCATEPRTSTSNPASAPSRYPSHPIQVSFMQTAAYGPDSSGDEDSWQTTWSFEDENGEAALNEPIQGEEAIEWHFASNFFLFIDENKSSAIDWDKCTDENGKRLNWKKLKCPFDQLKHRGLDPGIDGLVRIVFPAGAASNGYNISYRLVTYLDKTADQSGDKRLLALPYEYYMVEATLVWDSSGLRHHHKK